MQAQRVDSKMTEEMADAMLSRERFRLATRCGTGRGSISQCNVNMALDILYLRLWICGQVGRVHILRFGQVLL